MSSIISVVCFEFIAGRNMNKEDPVAVWCLCTCGSKWYFEILLKVVFVNGFTHMFIPL